MHSTSAYSFSQQQKCSSFDGAWMDGHVGAINAANHFWNCEGIKTLPLDAVKRFDRVRKINLLRRLSKGSLYQINVGQLTLGTQLCLYD